jgi:uncharacterized protein YyaL (SSP411 family)
MQPKHPFTNRLISEKSPYLLQHAHNPVDWYSWSSEAFEAARDQDKPIFLSIGYATCHWCHVMEKESFESVEIARLMNETFISIKVDREELPEVDNLYMEFAQGMISGSAGWPLNVILTPDLEPFFAATYLPPESSAGLMGLSELVMHVHEIWSSDDREKVLAQAHNIVEVFAHHVHSQGESLPEKEMIEDTAELLFKMADPVYGGMKGAPKFPIGYQMGFMMRYSAQAKDSRALFLADRTLDMMHRGGIYDHLGGGFSRYSVDEKWLVPHFEKMLYDNAILAFSYLEIWQITKNQSFKGICEEISNYVLRDMSYAKGGFYSAEDADSEGREGYFYTWSLEEIELILQHEASLFCEYYGVINQGNFHGRNILHTKESLDEFAQRKKLQANVLEERFEANRKLLWKVRRTRPHPLKDDKIITSWNGLMIFALAQIGGAFNHEPYLEAAVNAAQFIRDHMCSDGMLLRRWRDGEALYRGSIDDYAFLIRGLISLFEVDQGVEWLEWALQLTDVLKEHFKAEEGAFYQTDSAEEQLILRKCQFSDGAEPSGNAIHCENLLHLYQITRDPDYLAQAEDIMKAVKKFLESYSPGYCYHLMNMQRYYNRQAPTFVIALNQQENHREQIAQQINRKFLPHKAVVWRHQGDRNLFSLLPLVRDQQPLEGKTTLYICRQGVCERPLTDIDEIVEAIDHCYR